MSQQHKMRNPENVFSTTTLRAMSNALPTTQDAMLKVLGVTVAKWKNFDGNRFLQVTQRFASQVPSVETRSPYWGGKENGQSSTGKERGRAGEIAEHPSRRNQPSSECQVTLEMNLRQLRWSLRRPRGQAFSHHLSLTNQLTGHEQLIQLLLYTITSFVYHIHYLLSVSNNIFNLFFCLSSERKD